MATIGLDTLDARTAPEELFDTLTRDTSRFSKHDSYVDKLKNEIEPFYDDVLTNYTFYSRSRKSRRIMTKGEVDIVAIKGDAVHAYEVKCSNRITKARQQLKKIRKRLALEFSGQREIRTFFYCGSADMLTPLDD